MAASAASRARLRARPPPQPSPSPRFRRRARHRRPAHAARRRAARQSTRRRLATIVPFVPKRHARIRSSLGSSRSARADAARRARDGGVRQQTWPSRPWRTQPAGPGETDGSPHAAEGPGARRIVARVQPGPGISVP
ncbi:multidrug transporter [Burkholderia pseudomallei]|nr:multidrug transporter [Burkholderia pseudomallei]